MVINQIPAPIIPCQQLFQDKKENTEIFHNWELYVKNLQGLWWLKPQLQLKKFPWPIFFLEGGGKVSTNYWGDIGWNWSEVLRKFDYTSYIINVFVCKKCVKMINFTFHLPLIRQVLSGQKRPLLIITPFVEHTDWTLKIIW